MKAGRKKTSGPMVAKGALMSIKYVKMNLREKLDLLVFSHDLFQAVAILNNIFRCSCF